MSGPFDKSAKKPIDVSVQRNVRRNCEEEEEEERRSYELEARNLASFSAKNRFADHDHDAINSQNGIEKSHLFEGTNQSAR